MAHRKLRPGDPGFIEPILERLRTMPIEELDALLTPKEGVEVTNMNEELMQWYRRQAEKRETEAAETEPSNAKVA